MMEKVFWEGAFSRKPVLTMGIPIFEKNLPYYFTESYFLYGNILNNHYKRIKELRQSLKHTTSYKRQVAISKVIEALEYNGKQINRFVGNLKSYAEPEFLINFRKNPSDVTTGYLKDFQYLRRDWGGEPANEKQIRAIHEKLIQIPELSSDKETALFLGAGVGRIACELSASYDQLYLTDKSFSMAWHFKTLLSGGLSFYEIQEKNVAKVEDQTRLWNIDIKNPTYRSYSWNKVHYFVSDVLDLPIKRGTISAIYSVYFTDVIALKLWLPKVSQILKDGGVFVHYGPLDYFFSDDKELLSAEEFKDEFIQNGFEILKDEYSETTHLHTENSLSNKTYNNWFFVARKQSNANASIDGSSTFDVFKEVEYRVIGKLNGQSESNMTQLVLSNGSLYEGAELVVDILRQVNGENSVEQVLYILKTKHGDTLKLNLPELFGVFEFLLQNKLIRKV